MTNFALFFCDKHGQTSDVIWLPTTGLLIIRLDSANKKAFINKACYYTNWIFKLKRFFTVKKCSTPGCYTRKLLFANSSKIIRNWFLTLRPNIFKVIWNLPKWAQEKAWTLYKCLRGIRKREGWESLRFMFSFFCIFFWKRPHLIFHPRYQDGGKILSIAKPPVGRRWLEN